jgi:hypothetical protein
MKYIYNKYGMIRLTDWSNSFIAIDNYNKNIMTIVKLGGYQLYLFDDNNDIRVVGMDEV